MSAALVVEQGSLVGPCAAIFDLGSDVCMSYDAISCDDTLHAAPVTGRDPVWIRESASCITSNAFVNSSVDGWLVDTGCGYDLVPRDQTYSVRCWIQSAMNPRTFLKTLRTKWTQPGLSYSSVSGL